jgi:hypothetical protein
MKKLFILFIILISTQLKAQLYTVKGKVTGLSIEAIPFVAVNVQNQVNNVVTNEAGEYKLQLANGKYTLIFTCLGYETFKQDVIIKNENVTLNVILVENRFLLNEVEVNAKYSDPARRIVQQTIKNKGKYLQASYQCDLYIKAVETENKYVSKKDSLRRIEKYNDSLKKVEDAACALADSSLQKDKTTRYSDSVKVARKNKIFALDSIKWLKWPVHRDSAKLAEKKEKAIKDSIKAAREKPLDYERFNMAEIVSKKSFEHPDKLKEERIGYETWGDISGLFYLSATEGEFNFYQNAVYCPSVSQMPIQSPLSTPGLVMYKYKTLGVFMEDGKRIYRIRVEPNLFANSLVTGEMEIIDSLFCLRSFKFSFPKYQLAEYTSFVMETEFTPQDDSLYRIKKMTFDYKMGGKKNGSKGHTSVYYENFSYEKGFGKKYFKNEVSTTLQEAYTKDSSFWQQIRKEPLTEKELRFIRIEDSIKSAQESKPYLDSIDSVENKVTLFKIALLGQTHYNRVKELRFSFNPLWSCYQPVGVGGARINYGIGVDKKFKNKKTASAFVHPSYGILNHDMNGTISLGGLYDPVKRSYWNVDAGRSFDIVNASNTWTAFFRTSNYYLNQHVEASHSTELFNGLYWGAKVEYSLRKSISGFKNDSLTNLFFDNGSAKPLNFDYYNAFYITNYISYTPEQKYIREPYEKIVLGSKYPTFTVSYRKGIPGIFNSSINFDYLEYSITKDIDFRFLGISKIRLYTGKFYNSHVIKQIDYKYQPRVGFPFFGNPLSSFQSLEKSYITLDRFYASHYFHRFNGALINKIPYAKYLKLTESAGGGFLRSKENNLTYFEVYAGIEKNVRIFKEMFRFGFWFVESKTNNYPFSSGFRFSIDVYDRVRNAWTY